MIPELVASVATFAVTTLWLGPCDIVYLWSLLNCFGLNFELWVQKLAEREPLAHMEVSREGMAGHRCSLKAPQPPLVPSPELSHHHLVVRTMAHLGVSGPPCLLCGVETPGCYVGQALPSLQTSVCPSLTMRETWPGTLRPGHIPGPPGPCGKASD